MSTIPIMRKRADFLAANRGTRVVTPAFVLLVHRRNPDAMAEGAPRVGFTVSKKVGNAVARNRAKRRLREMVRVVLPQGAIAGADHVFIARRVPDERPFPDLLADGEQALRRAQRRLAGKQASGRSSAGHSPGRSS